MLKTFDHRDWLTPFTVDEQGSAIASLERGEVIFFPQLPFEFLPHEDAFFTSAYSTKSKNISYNAKTSSIRGAHCSEQIQRDLQVMIQRYVDTSTALMHALFPSYTQHLQVGRTSFRPIEIAGRIPKSIRKDDTKLHVDAFPTTPTQGNRIIRVFTNVHPDQKSPRVWRLGEPFEQVAQRFLPKVKRPWFGRGSLLKALRITRGYATEYDYTMLQLHHLMKSDPNYQKEVSQQEIHFAPGCTWIVFSDQVSHAAHAGQHLLEQTFYLPVTAQAYPQQSPLKTLERLTGRVLVR